jgi:hypothetical protein
MPPLVLFHYIMKIKYNYDRHSTIKKLKNREFKVTTGIMTEASSAYQQLAPTLEQVKTLSS